MQQLAGDAQTWPTLLAGAAVAAGSLLIRKLLFDCQLPPGPWGVPLLGMVPFLDRGRLHEQVLEMRRRYGPISSYRVGGQLFITVSRYDMIKEMLEDANFGGRPLMMVLSSGIIFAEGNTWSAQRRMALRTLRDFGFATTRSVELINEQVSIVFEMLNSAIEANRPVLMLDSLTEVTNSVIGALTLGTKFARGDKDFEFVKTLTQGLFARRRGMSLSFIFPSLGKLLKLLAKSQSDGGVQDEMGAFVKRYIQQREKLNEDPSFEPECLCDVYLQERRAALAKGDSETFNDQQVIRVILELFFAGTDTTARSLEWLLIYTAFHPKVQQKVQQELDAVIGSGRRPEMTDRQQLNYTLATIEESMRIVSLSPNGLMHRALKTTKFHGYLIPDDALIVPFVYGVSRDESIWPQPEEFRPERFLDPSGRFKGPGKNIPFLIGRRSCAGESLARMEIFLVFSSILQRYSLSLSSEVKSQRDEILRGTVGILRIPGDCPITFTHRG